jgi:SAM-dependent methyltransferase
VLQEYFVPVGRLDEFVPKMAEVLRRHGVNMVNVSIRHARADPGSLLAWAREEVFAFVLYYKQRVRPNARDRVAVWTRELVEAALSVGGTYYLPYQPHATPAQFLRAYPRAGEMFALKRRLDPDFRFRNALWDTYYAPTLQPVVTRRVPDSEFHAVYSDADLQDGFYRFLQNVYRLYPEDRFHTLIKQACAAHSTDEAIYRHLQENLAAIKPPLSEVFYALPSLAKQKREMARQTREILGNGRAPQGYVEIGTPGRYVAALRGALGLGGPVFLVNDTAPTNSPVDIVERGGLGAVGRFVPMNDYAAFAPQGIPAESVDLVSCFIGLHHAPPERLEGFVSSIARVLRPGGRFVLRDHDVRTPAMNAFVSLAHTVFNAGLGLPWEVNQQERRRFAPVADWVRVVEGQGLRDSGRRLLQAHDPTDNTLLVFDKATRAPAP